MAELLLTTQGPGRWIVPAGVTSIQVECWGGGGSGGYRFTNGAASGGGSAGWAKTNAIAVTPGQTVCFHVGAGGAARSGANLAGLDGEDTWLNVSANAAPSSATVGCLAQNGRHGNHGATVAGGASFVNGGAIGDTSRNGRNNNGVNAAGSANGGSGASTPLSLGDVAAFIGTAGVEGAGGNAGTGGGSGGAARTQGDDDADGGGGGGGSITASTTGGRGGQPGGGGGGAVTPATASGAGGDGQIRITYTAAPTASARRVAIVMMLGAHELALGQAEQANRLAQRIGGACVFLAPFVGLCHAGPTDQLDCRWIKPNLGQVIAAIYTAAPPAGS